jgi:hypothetical protein
MHVRAARGLRISRSRVPRRDLIDHPHYTTNEALP